MRCMVRGLVILGILVLVVAVIVAGVGIWFVRRPWPQVKGSLEVEGLSAPVRVLRDENGVPHIFAENEPDLFFAQGYVHAQDRLWQMEFNRRIISGTLSAVLGESLVGTDRFLRTVGLRRAAEADWALADDELRTIVESYARGVNAYIETNRNRLPLEFTILGFEPAPWTPVDSLGWSHVMAMQLGQKYDYELLRARLIADLGEQAAQELLPPYPEEGPFIIPPEARNYAWLRGTSSNAPDALASVLGARGSIWGSNNWVVHGSRTATGLPLLANDTHLGLNMPSIWYLNGLHGGRYDVAGFSFPGVPAVVIGYNEKIAWAVTNLEADVQDLYMERLNDEDEPTQYEFQGEWRDLEIVPETIEVKDGEPVVEKVLITHHGPIMNGVVDGLSDAEPMALRWTGHDGNQILKSVTVLDLAGNWEEFQQALHYWDAPCQNVVYADVEGNIGYQTPCKIPVRSPGHQGLVPVPGWSGEYEWQGIIPWEELPSVLNPPTAFIATANNKVVPDEYPYFLSYEWSAPYRAQRITDLLAANDRVTLDDMQGLQAQTYSLPAEVLRPYLLAVEPGDELQKRAQELVEAWDLYLEIDRAGASIYEVWYWFLAHNTLRDELGDELSGDYLPYQNLHVPMMIDLMAQPDSPWFDNVTTPEVENRDDIVRRSLADAVAWLSEEYGEDPEKWEWGKLHSITFVHQPLGQSGIGVLESLFNSKTIPARGDPFTVDAATFAFEQPFAMQHGVSQRLIVDLDDVDNTLAIHTTGQSGQLLHRHREDFITPWENVEYYGLPLSREAVEGQAKQVLTLTPP